MCADTHIATTNSDVGYSEDNIMLVIYCGIHVILKLSYTWGVQEAGRI